jgi:hypothetical protein
MPGKSIGERSMTKGSKPHLLEAYQNGVHPERVASAILTDGLLYLSRLRLQEGATDAADRLSALRTLVLARPFSYKAEQEQAEIDRRVRDLNKAIDKRKQPPPSPPPPPHQAARPTPDGEQRFFNAFWREQDELRRLEQAQKRRLERSANGTLGAALARGGFGLGRSIAYFTEVLKSAAVPILIAGATLAFAAVLGAHR